MVCVEGEISVTLDALKAALRDVAKIPGACDVPRQAHRSFSACWFMSAVRCFIGSDVRAQ
jgi:hypothetical protein